MDQALLPPPDADQALRAQLIWCEGLTRVPYRDTAGFLTVGVGWNLSANGLPDWAIDGLYDQAVAAARSSLDRVTPWWKGLDPVRGRAMVNLMYNMGATKLLAFRDFLAAMQVGAWDKAANALEASAWWGEVGKRGPMVRQMIVSGVDPGLGA